MLNDALPAPLPVVGPDSVIHPALLVADHAHPAWAVTAVEPVVAGELTVCAAGLIEYVHGAAACVTV
jgi:hypothetical protein